jgi:hypothetical protein
MMVENPSVRDLIRSGRERIQDLDRAERQHIGRGEWAMATTCAYARMQEAERVQMLMRDSYSGEEVV